MKTDTSCMLPVIGCLEAAQKFIQGKTGFAVPAWNASNDRQKEFLVFYGQLIGKLNVPELENKASEQVAVINDWLKVRGYDIQLEDSGGPDGFAVASILDVLMKWIAEGVKTSVKGHDGKTYPAVRLKADCGVSIFEHNQYYPYPVVKIRTQSEDVVCMSMADSQPASLLSVTNKLGGITRSSTRFSGVIFPMIDLDVKPDISWIEGMELLGWHIDQAKQQTKFRMNEIGAHVQSAAAMHMKRGISITLEPVVIDRPFLLWIERRGLAIPLFSAVLAEDCWKQPKEL